MRPWMPALLDAIRANTRGQIYRAFQGLNLVDTVEAISFTGPERVQNVLTTYPVDLSRTPTQTRTAAGTVDVSLVCASVLRHWGVVLAPTQTPRPSATISAAITQVGEFRRAAPRAGVIARELTSLLPQPSARPARLTDADIVASAQRLGAEPAAVRAVASVESSGDGFDVVGRPKILFEAHHFLALTTLRFGTTHPHLSRPYSRSREFRAYYAWDQWTRMYEALLLDPSAAIRAASWGKFQGLGRYQTAWPSEFDYARAMFVGERNHLIAFEAFVRDKGLVPALRRNDFLTFARGYNGADQVGYDTRMRTAYDTYRRARR
jgi:N-acetylmuramidase